MFYRLYVCSSACRHQSLHREMIQRLHRKVKVMATEALILAVQAFGVANVVKLNMSCIYFFFLNLQTPSCLQWNAFFAKFLSTNSCVVRISGSAESFPTMLTQISGMHAVGSAATMPIKTPRERIERLLCILLWCWKTGAIIGFHHNKSLGFDAGLIPWLYRWTVDLPVHFVGDIFIGPYAVVKSVYSNV